MIDVLFVFLQIPLRRGSKMFMFVKNGPLPFGKFEYVVSWLYRELTALPVFLRALWNPTVVWRSGVYRLRWGGVAEEIKKPAHLMTIHA